MTKPRRLLLWWNIYSGCNWLSRGSPPPGGIKRSYREECPRSRYYRGTGKQTYFAVDGTRTRDLSLRKKI